MSINLLIFKIFKDFGRWPDEPLEEMDSTLAVQQYIQQLIKKDPSNIEQILTMPESQDEGVWKYEHLRCITNATCLTYAKFNKRFSILLLQF